MTQLEHPLRRAQFRLCMGCQISEVIRSRVFHLARKLVSGVKPVEATVAPGQRAQRSGMFLCACSRQPDR